MAITLRARPTCHYCGKRNKPINNQSRFTCQYCQAENYLDESGQIDDVPYLAAAPTQQYAVPITPTFEIPQNSIFCSTCLKNQHMYNSALSEYLPDPDHPDYDRIEAAIPAFKKDLERRFPTCCTNCEPKVRAQLQQATYNARSDHVRRVLDRSKQRRNASNLGWRSLLVRAAGFGWLFSLAIQLTWHALASQTNEKTSAPNIQLTECLKTWPVSSQCPAMVEKYISFSLLLGVTCIWWNPKWHHRLEGREGRLVGLDRFYKVQTALLAVRFALWTICKDVPVLSRFRPALHAISLVLITMVAAWSRQSIIEVYMPRIVDWSQDPAPLLDKKQYMPPSRTQEISPPSSQQPVPVNIFDTSSAPPLQPWRPPTPPLDEDAMEWDPTPATFLPNPKHIHYKSTEPSPFQGTLPAFPQRGIYSTKAQTQIEQPAAIGLPAGMFDKSQGRSLNVKQNQKPDYRDFAQPKFFPTDARADTGLESIFDKVFSLGDDIQVSETKPSSAFGTKDMFGKPNDLPRSHSNTEVGLKVQSRISIFTCSILIVLTTFFLTQSWLDAALLHVVSMESTVRLAAVIPLMSVLIHCMSSMAKNTFNLKVSRVFIPLLESACLLTLSYKRPEIQSVLSPLWNKFVIAVLTFSLAQDAYTSLIDNTTVLDHGSPMTTHREPVKSAPVFVENKSTIPISVESSNIRRSSSDESLASTASAATSSTVSGWKTPVRNHREDLRNGLGSGYLGLNNLSLQNNNDFGTGSNVAGPRTRRTPARGSQRQG